VNFEIHLPQWLVAEKLTSGPVVQTSFRKYIIAQQAGKSFHAVSLSLISSNLFIIDQTFARKILSRDTLNA